MSAWQAIKQLQVLLAAIPDTTLPTGHCSIRRPVVASQLPALAVSAQDVTELAVGLGGLVETRRVPTAASSIATRCAGVLAIELWTADAATMDDLVEATVAALHARSHVAAAGFSSLSVRSIGPSDSAVLGADALRLAIGCTFCHEAVTAAEESEGRISTVQVELLDELHEVMEIP